ncbi:MAG: GNAT family N-acetyltransferase [Chloroflexota bacterium]
MTGELAHRIERALTCSWESRLEHIQQLPANPLGIALRRGRLTSATLVARDVFYYGLFNAVRGLGVGGEDELDDALTWFRQHDRPCSVFVTSFDANEHLLHHHSEHGLRPSGFMSVMCGVPERPAPEPGAATPSAVTVEAVPTPGLEPFLSLSVPTASDEDRDFLRLLRKAEFTDWHCYVASVDGQPAAIAGLYVRDGVGVMAAGYTLPAFRHQGCQAALLRRRIADAAAAGCDLVLTQTRPHSTSQRNVERSGLRTAYTQLIWSTGRQPARTEDTAEPDRVDLHECQLQRAGLPIDRE